MRVVTMAFPVFGLAYGYIWSRNWQMLALFVVLVIPLAFIVVEAVHHLRLDCPHAHVRCVHGDEILFGAGGRRVRCLDCGRALDRPLPALCTFTGLAHGVSDWREH
jgi:hypothetical protein